MKKHRIERTKMKFKIFFEYPDCTDEIVIEGENIPELREIAAREEVKRKPLRMWSEQIAH